MKSVTFTVGRHKRHQREPPMDPDPLASYDALYRKQPKRLGAVEGFRAVPWLLHYFDKEVPGSFWMLDGDEAVISCPCGHTPYVPFNVLVECDGPDCGRCFFFDGNRVRVARNAEGSDASAPEPSTSVSP